MDPDPLFDSDLILSSNGIGGHRKKELNSLQKKIKLGLLPHGLKAASHGGIVESKNVSTCSTTRRPWHLPGSMLCELPSSGRGWAGLHYPRCSRGPNRICIQPHISLLRTHRFATSLEWGFLGI